MNWIKTLFIIILTSLSRIIPCQVSTGLNAEEKLQLLRKSVSENLTENILSFWSAKMPDDTNGGFYGRINSNNEVVANAEKGGILNARILWTYSAAYRVTGNPQYLELATRSRDYILDHFIDRKYGGAYRSLNAIGEPLDTRKQTYTQAFFIYGLSEYSRATGDKTALKEAKKIFELFEKHALDKESNGYFEVFTRDWKRSSDRLIGEQSALEEKTMNTSLHVLEAYANLYRVWPSERMAERLRNMINVFIEHIVDKETFHLICFLDRNWNPVSKTDSYGHDIESSWLLYEAAHLLKDETLEKKVAELSLKIADAAAEGLLPDGSMITEKNRETGHTSTNRSWWEQAESVVGFTNAWELSGNSRYLDHATRAWHFIDKYMVDKKNGAWFTSVTPEGTARGDKAGFWICPYHNGRMCMELMERVKPGDWKAIFNGRDLEGWTPKVTGHNVGENPLNGIHVKDGMIRFDYSSFEKFDGRFSHLFYKEKLSSYILRIEYRFAGEMLSDAPSYCYRNSGVMIHSQSAESMDIMQNWPVSLEAQFLGSTSTRKQKTGNICTPGTTISYVGKATSQHCINSTSDYYYDDQWVTIDIVVHGGKEVYHLIAGETIMHYTDPLIGGNLLPEDYPVAVGTRLTEGYVALQGEGQGIDFRKVELLILNDE